MDYRYRNSRRYMSLAAGGGPARGDRLLGQCLFLTLCVTWLLMYNLQNLNEFDRRAAMRDRYNRYSRRGNERFHGRIARSLRGNQRLLVEVKNRGNGDFEDSNSTAEHPLEPVELLDAMHKVRDELHHLWEQIKLKRLRPPDSAYNINVTKSDKLNFDRPIRDIRPQECKRPSFNQSRLSSATVVIPVYNEALSVFLRTVHSVLNRSPDSLLHEIIIVDDNSSYADLLEPLESYLRLLPKTRLLRNDKREGLIRSRLRGATLAQTEVVVFLDAHTECAPGWLEPLLHYLQDHPTAVVQPEVDEINASTMVYVPKIVRERDFRTQEILRGGFSWDLRFGVKGIQESGAIIGVRLYFATVSIIRFLTHMPHNSSVHACIVSQCRFAWMPIPAEEQRRRTSPGEPYRSLTLVGCVIAVQKEEFFRMGAFDEQMNIWGGENIELAFRTWQCGGTVMTVPCSRVGHIYKPFPYSFDGNKEKIVGKNLIRVAEIWMDDYKKFFHAAWRAFPFKRVGLTREDRLSIRHRRSETRDKFQCRDFNWYLTSVASAVNIPPDDAILFGEIFNDQSAQCLRLHASDPYLVMHNRCFSTRVYPEHEFFIDLRGNLRHVVRTRECILPDDNLLLHSTACPEQLADAANKSDILTHGTWQLIGEVSYGHLMYSVLDTHTGETDYKCMGQVTNSVQPHLDMQVPQLRDCDMNSAWQKWWFSYKLSAAPTTLGPASREIVR